MRGRFGIQKVELLKKYMPAPPFFFLNRALGVSANYKLLIILIFGEINKLLLVEFGVVCDDGWFVKQYSHCFPLFFP